MHWPYAEWRNNIVFVLDAENEQDTILAAVLAVAYRMFNVSVFLESPPPAGTLSGNMRSEGYSRTQWSNFYSDLYTGDDVEYIGIFDADTEIPYRPNPDDLFDPQTGKPLIRGVGVRTPFCPSAEFMTGGVCAGDFMVTFPFIVRRSHFPLMRAHITLQTQSASFEEAWYKMQTQYPPWSNFVTMGNYLWHYHHSEYDWRLFRLSQYNLSDPDDAYVFTYAKPTVYAGKHLVMENDVVTAARYHQQMCEQSDYTAADCAEYRHNATRRDLARLTLWMHGWYTEEMQRVWCSEERTMQSRRIGGGGRTQPTESTESSMADGRRMGALSTIELTGRERPPSRVHRLSSCAQSTTNSSSPTTRLFSVG